MFRIEETRAFKFIYRWTYEIAITALCIGGIIIIIAGVVDIVIFCTT